MSIHQSDAFPNLKARVDQADALLLGTPDDHGSFTSTLKYFLDRFWQEFAAKLFATVVASYDTGLTASDQLRTAARQCHGWSKPYVVSFAVKADLKDGQRISEPFRQGVEMFARDILVFGTVLAQQRCADLNGSHPGFLARSRKK